jgi:class 3 adenylate cyclase
MAHKIDVKLKHTYLALVLLDLVGSTAFVQKVGPIKAARWLQFHDRLARSVCYKNNGREIDRSDGFLMSFDSMSDAVKFALEYNKRVMPKTGLKARIGIHWGEIVEVHQDELFVGVGAKKVELEGISKNIAARTMSLADPSQILLTKDAFKRLVATPALRLPKELRSACVGLYNFKGVAELQEIYSVAEDVDLLQPPKGNEKAKRLGGPKYIKKRLRDRKIKDWFKSFYKTAAPFAVSFSVYAIYKISLSHTLQQLFGLELLSALSPYSEEIQAVINSLLETVGQL